MEKYYHILNGDALKAQFPPDIPGEVIVARECLVDGDVQSSSLEEFFQIRARFIVTSYGDDYTAEDYQRDTVSEFEKIRNLPPGSTVHLWFEDDLFCQVNLWFVSYLLLHHAQNPTVFLIRPKEHTPYGFGGLSTTELEQAFADKIALPNLGPWALLWETYRDAKTEALVHTAREMQDSFPFVLPAVEAHLARIPTETSPGRPTEALQEIMRELGTDRFGPVFREFHQRESIYGFGDLQVKRLFDALQNTP